MSSPTIYKILHRGRARDFSLHVSANIATQRIKRKFIDQGVSNACSQKINFLIFGNFLARVCVEYREAKNDKRLF